MPAGDNLVADIETNYGTFSCQLWPTRAPNTVANFVGLSRGLRDFWDPVGGAWVRRPYFDGTVFHRVIPGFMAQGGDVLRDGHGGPGYEFADENTAHHDQAGLLCMANHGPNTNGSQFFILEEPKAHLDGSYSVFGRCSPVELVRRITGVSRSPNDRPNEPVLIRHVRVHR
jgi:peptidyl-prolyl cis-trans isomerase A (cyclophilin A)